MKSRIEIKRQAKQNFTKQYWIGVVAFAIISACLCFLSGYNSGATMMDIIGGSSFLPIMTTFTVWGAISWIATLVLAPPLAVGYASYVIDIYNGKKGNIGSMFNNGFKSFWRNVGGILWMQLFTVLWTLLFIIPGIVKAIAYSMTPYILADSKNVSPKEALKISMKMTNGYKGDIFVMYLSFIGWGILTSITCGILAIFYTGPYVSTSFAGLYCELKQNALDKGIVTTEELGN